jgi:integrase
MTEQEIASGEAFSEKSEQKGCILSRVPLILESQMVRTFHTLHNIQSRSIFSLAKVRKYREGTSGITAHRCLVHGGRRAADAGIETAIGCHTFRATGITDYLTNGGRIEVAQRMAGHSNAKTTGLYDRRNDDVSVGEVERVGI